MYRWTVVAVASAALALSACSSGTKVTILTPASATAPASSSSSGSSGAAAAGAPLGTTGCADVTEANLDLATATDAAAARKAGDAFEKYDLPSSVKDAVEHFVGTKGMQIDDTDRDKYNNAIEDWIKQVCPV